MMQFYKSPSPHTAVGKANPNPTPSSTLKHLKSVYIRYLNHSLCTNDSNFFRYSLKKRKLVFGKKIKFELTGNTLKGESFKYWKALEVKEVKEERDSDWLETLSYLTTPISTKAI